MRPGMRIAVCIKQVPNTEARLRVSRDGRWLEEEDLPFVINESDEYALEEGLQLAEKTGGEVVVFSLGPERVKEALRKTLEGKRGRGRVTLVVPMPDDAEAEVTLPGTYSIAGGLRDAIGGLPGIAQVEEI